jgi:hypothetical protein
VTNPLTGVTLMDRPELAGDIIFEETRQFTDGEFFSGTFRTRVVRETVSGTLDFYYLAAPTQDAFSVTGFDAFTTDVDFRLDIPGDPDPGGGASGVARSEDGDTLFFSFRNGFTFVQTNATDFARTGSAAFSDPSGNIARLSGVATPIPLPPALYAGLTGLAIAAGCYRWHRRHLAR